MKITAIEIRDFKRVREVALRPSADTYVVLIAGDNAQGKTSILDALTAAFGGGRAIPADPVRHGADRADIRIELDGGALIVSRKITADSETLMLRNADGVEQKRPQELLKSLVGSSFLDPFEFMQQKEADQRATLLKLIPNADAIVELDVAREEMFDKRRGVNRQLKEAEGELARMPNPDPVDEVDIGAIYKRIGELKAQSLEMDQANAALKAAQTAAARVAAEVERLRGELALAQERARAAEKEEADARAKWSRAASRYRLGDGEELADLERSAVAAGEDNKRAAAARVQRERHAAAAAAVDQLGERSRRLTTGIEQLDADKAKALAEAKLPVEGLGFTDAGVTFGGVPLAQASGAERLRVALALAIATRPKLRDVWIRDGALLDSASLSLIVELAREHKCRVWIERVGDADPGAIVISDGKIAKGKC
jgi:DNA repair exonuclease SbcCD ATPase subunit